MVPDQSRPGACAWLCADHAGGPPDRCPHRLSFPERDLALPDREDGGLSRPLRRAQELRRALREPALPHRGLEQRGLHGGLDLHQARDRHGHGRGSSEGGARQSAPARVPAPALGHPHRGHRADVALAARSLPRPLQRRAPRPRHHRGGHPLAGQSGSGHALGHHGQCLARLPLLRRLLPRRHADGAPGSLRRRLGGRRLRVAAVLAGEPAVDQGRRRHRHPAQHDLDAQRLQHRLHHDPRGPGGGPPHLPHVFLRARHSVPALGAGHGRQHVLAARPRAAHCLRGPLPAPRGAGLVSGRVLRWLAVGILLFLVAVPLYWIVVTSLKTGRQILMSQAIYIAKPFTLENYTYLFEETRFVLWLRNSAVTAVASTMLSLAIGAAGAYALTRLRFAGRRAFGALVLLTHLLPPRPLFIPPYRTLIPIGYNNSLGTPIVTYP